MIKNYIKFYLTCLFVLVSHTLTAQLEASHWLHTANKGYKFTESSIDTYDYTQDLGNMLDYKWVLQSTMSDAAGNLLFYHLNGAVYNSNHQQMPNGDVLGLFHVSNPGGVLHHDTIKSLIVPHPGNSDLFYVFYPHGPVHASSLKLSYSVIDMSLNGGLGDVTSVKNILLINEFNGELEAVFGANGIDVILILVDQFTNHIKTFFIDSSGINNTPVLTKQIFPFNRAENRNKISISPDGKKLAINDYSGANNTFEQDLLVYDFDSSTGLISNEILLHRTSINTNEIFSTLRMEFSSNSNYLYLYGAFVQHMNGSFISSEEKIARYNLSTVTANSLPSPILSLTGSNLVFYYSTMELAIDGKIYVYNFSVSSSIPLSVIDNPDSDTIETTRHYKKCDFEYSYDGDFDFLRSPPNVIKSYLKKDFSYSNVCDGDLVEFQSSLPPHFDTFLWRFGERNSISTLENPSYQYSSVGDYVVTLEASSSTTGETYIDSRGITIQKNLIANDIDDYILCDEDDDGVENFNLLTRSSLLTDADWDINFYFYESQEDLENDNPIVEPGNYSNLSNPQEIFVKLIPECGGDCIEEDTTSFDIGLIEYPEVFLEPIYYLCEDEELILELPPGYDEYNWSNGDTTSTATITSTGNYFVEVVYENNGGACSVVIEFEVLSRDASVDVEVRDFTLNDNSIRVSVDGDDFYEYSLDGITYQNSNVFTNLPIGEYTVYVRDTDGCFTISLDVVMLFYPRFFTPNGDGFNDNWQVINGNFATSNIVSIFDRYGKLLTSFSTDSVGWDGTSNGVPLPSSDYWFTMKREDGSISKGHFTLKR
ncbi:gliding motility-associated-like protein [Nonlabens dokdonensis]|uniref:PKD domain-containing protein n=2 Tax=Nonlabens dokdonensis TaxID=328515 RepID=L7WFG2_NONDD|nr:T9SS type B sorting domain-containing protein [Nonlabens dokdonensis]AGC78696.1 hypothetical protein DDD_3569 [Nonlabens dokdonensis DSW-6]PZX39177.1 gliding motility-associated-like protein [Nonlabens dokdonensis]